MGKRTTHPGLYKRGAYWWLRTDPVTGSSISTRCTSVKAALGFQEERERIAHDPSYAASKKVTIAEQVERVLKAKRAANKSESTMSYYEEKLGHIGRVLGDHTPLVAVSADRIDAYVTQRREEGASDHTVCKERTVFNMVLNHAKRLSLWAGDTAALWPKDLEPKYKPRARALTTDEIDALTPYLDDQKASLLAISCALGLRRKEALNLQPADVDMARGMVAVKGTKTEGANREVPILSPFKHLVERALPYLPILEAPNNLYRDIRVACKRAGIDYCTPNDWRRTFASILAEQGVALDVTRHFTGHTDTKMLEKVYSRPRVAALRDLAETAIGKRSNGVANANDSQVTSTGYESAKYAESDADHQKLTGTERFPKPEVSSSNLLGSAGNPDSLSQGRSSGLIQPNRRAFGKAGRADASATLALPIGKLVSLAAAAGALQ